MPAREHRGVLAGPRAQRLLVDHEDRRPEPAGDLPEQAAAYPEILAVDDR